MLSQLIKMLGKKDCHPQAECLFDNENQITKITVSVSSAIYLDLLTSISSKLNAHMDEKTLIGVLEEPTHTLNYPHSLKKQTMLFYGHEHYWLAWKFTENTLETISIMSPSIIPDVIKYGQGPMRICR